MIWRAQIGETVEVYISGYGPGAPRWLRGRVVGWVANRCRVRLDCGTEWSVQHLDYLIRPASAVDRLAKLGTDA